MAEHLICNQRVEGSIPFSSIFFPQGGCRIAAIAMDCKSIDFGLRQFESGHPQIYSSIFEETLLADTVVYRFVVFRQIYLL